jgi:hypothetical protein
VEAIMSDTTLTLNQDEREFLVGLLQNTLKTTRIEEHRTRTPSYREHVMHNEELLISMLQKLGQSPE